MSDRDASAAENKPDGSGELVAELDRIANELGRCAMQNDFSTTLLCTSASESVQKLVLMINVLLDCAHTALTSVRGAMLEIAAPTIPVWDGVLMVPILGTLDKERADILSQSVLPAVVAHRARSVILDLTGTATFDTASAASLLRLAQALRLLGADPIVVGLRPALAQVLIRMDINLDGIRTQSTLQEALRQCIEKTGDRG